MHGGRRVEAESESARRRRVREVTLGRRGGGEHLVFAHLRWWVLVRAGAIGVEEARVVRVLVLLRRAERLLLLVQAEHPRGNVSSWRARAWGGAGAQVAGQRGNAHRPEPEGESNRHRPA